MELLLHTQSDVHMHSCTEECGNGGMEGVGSEEEIPCWTQGQGACGLSIV